MAGTRTIPTVAEVIAELPGAGTALLSVVNEFLPEDSRLPETATGNDIENAIHSMPSESRAELIKKQFDIDITQIKESHSTIRAMLESDAKNQHTTRPWIAQQSFNAIPLRTIVNTTPRHAAS
jgi:hypothetical protein